MPMKIMEHGSKSTSHGFPSRTAGVRIPSPAPVSFGIQPVDSTPAHVHNGLQLNDEGHGVKAVALAVRRNRCAIGEKLAVLFCPATNGKIFAVTIDIEDLPRVQAAGFWQVHNFTCSRPGHFSLYAFRNKRGGGAELLHRFVMSAKPGQFIDHQNHRTLDDRKSELRHATRAQNAQNARTRKDNRTGIKGVTPDPRSGRYRARIRSGGKQVSLGMFSTAEEAGKAYAEAAKQHHGEFAFTAAGRIA